MLLQREEFHIPCEVLSIAWGPNRSASPFLQVLKVIHCSAAAPSQDRLLRAAWFLNGQVSASLPTPHQATSSWPGDHEPLCHILTHIPSCSKAVDAGSASQSMPPPLEMSLWADVTRVTTAGPLPHALLRLDGFQCPWPPMGTDITGLHRAPLSGEG